LKESRLAEKYRCPEPLFGVFRRENDHRLLPNEGQCSANDLVLDRATIALCYRVLTGALLDRELSLVELRQLH
jgi:hypothetical protein